MFVFGSIPLVKSATPFKYWTSLIVYGVGLYKTGTHMNN